MPMHLVPVAPQALAEAMSVDMVTRKPKLIDLLLTIPYSIAFIVLIISIVICETVSEAVGAIAEWLEDVFVNEGVRKPAAGEKPRVRFCWECGRKLRGSSFRYLDPGDGIERVVHVQCAVEYKRPK